MKCSLFFSCLIFPFFVLGQNTKSGFGAIRGTILTSDGQPAPYVSVVIKNTKEGTTSDENGSFEIKKIKSCASVLSFSLLCYVDTTITVEVLDNETVLLKVRLQRTSAELKAVIIRVSGYVETKTSESLRLN